MGFQKRFPLRKCSCTCSTHEPSFHGEGAQEMFECLRSAALIARFELRIMWKWGKQWTTVRLKKELKLRKAIMRWISSAHSMRAFVHWFVTIAERMNEFSRSKMGNQSITLTWKSYRMHWIRLSRGNKSFEIWDAPISSDSQSRKWLLLDLDNSGFVSIRGKILLFVSADKQQVFGNEWTKECQS